MRLRITHLTSADTTVKLGCIIRLSALDQEEITCHTRKTASLPTAQRNAFDQDAAAIDTLRADGDKRARRLREQMRADEAIAARAASDAFGALPAQVAVMAAEQAARGDRTKARTRRSTTAR